MSEYRVATWETEYKRAFINARSPKQAKRIALESLRGQRSDVEWHAFGYEGGQIEDIEKV